MPLALETQSLCLDRGYAAGRRITTPQSGRLVESRIQRTRILMTGTERFALPAAEAGPAARPFVPK